MTRSAARFALGIAVTAAVALAGLPAGAAAPQVPSVMSYQGVLLDDLGAPRTGFVDLEIRIWDALLGGTLLYVQSFPNTPLSAGTFTLDIGPTGAASDPGGDPLTTSLAAVFTGDLVAGPDRFLGLTVGSDPALVRIQILAAPLTLRAESAVHADIADAALTADVAGETTQVGGVDAEFVSQIFAHFSFDGSDPPNDDPREGLADVDGDGQANFIDVDNDGDGISDASELAEGSDMNLVTPVIAGVTPPSAGQEFTTDVTVTGTGFEPSMTVAFGSESPVPSNVSSTSFDVTVGPQPAGAVDVQVTRTNGETDLATGAFSFIPGPTTRTVNHGVSNPTPRIFSIRRNDSGDAHHTLLGSGDHDYAVDADADGVPETLVTVAVGGEADYAYAPSNEVTGLGCRLPGGGTCEVVVMRDDDADLAVDPNDSAEATVVESFTGLSLVSARLAFAPSGAPVAAYARSRGGAVDVVVADDRDANGDYAGTNEVVAIESDLSDAEVELAVDASGRAAVLYRSDPGTGPVLRLGYDLSGDGDFDDTVGGVPELQTVLNEDATCFGVAFDGGSELAVLYRAASGTDVILARDQNGDGDVADAGEAGSLNSNTTPECAMRSITGRLALVYGRTGVNLPEMRFDRDGDGAFNPLDETFLLTGWAISPFGLDGDAYGHFGVAGDTKIRLSP